MSALQRFVVSILVAVAVAAVVLAAHMRTAAAASDRIVAGNAGSRAALAAEQRRLVVATADVRRLTIAYAGLRRATTVAEARLLHAIAVARHARPRHRRGSARVRYVRLRRAAG